MPGRFTRKVSIALRSNVYQLASITGLRIRSVIGHTSARRGSPLTQAIIFEARSRSAYEAPHPRTPRRQRVYPHGIFSTKQNRSEDAKSEDATKVTMLDSWQLTVGLRGKLSEKNYSVNGDGLCRVFDNVESPH